MNLHVIETGFFKLDGGAMFGVVPKTIWEKRHAPDAKNLCTWAMRCLLIEEGDRLILIDNGIGNKQDEKFFGHYDLHGDDSLDGSLKKAGFHKNDVTDVFLTHLHFDHCGGSIERQGDLLVPAFKNATFWSNADHWKWATAPNPREKASFLKENIIPIEESGQLKLIGITPSPKTSRTELGFEILRVDGHTDAMMLPHIKHKGRTLVYTADLLPSIHHISLPWVMAYDTRPLITMTEKQAFLERAADEDLVLFFEHDAQNQCATLERTERGIKLKETFPLSAL